MTERSPRILASKQKAITTELSDLDRRTLFDKFQVSCVTVVFILAIFLAVVSFSPLARIWGKCSTTRFPPAFLSSFSLKWKLAHAN